MRNFIFNLIIVLGFMIAFSCFSYAEKLELHTSGDPVEIYDYIEFAIEMSGVNVANPFTEITVAGEFARDNQHMSHVNPDLKFEISWINIDTGKWGTTSTLTGRETIPIIRPDDTAHWIAVIVRK